MKNWYRFVDVLLVLALFLGLVSETAFAAPPTPTTGLRLTGNVIGEVKVPGGAYTYSRALELAHRDFGPNVDVRLVTAERDYLTEGGGFVRAENHLWEVFTRGTEERIALVQVECWNRVPPQISFSATCESRSIRLDNTGGGSAQIAKARVVWKVDSQQPITDTIEVAGGKIEEVSRPWPFTIYGGAVVEVESRNDTGNSWADTLNKRETIPLSCPLPQATITADIDCDGITLSGSTEVAATVVYTATANEVTLSGSFEVEPGKFNKSIGWSEELLAFDPYQMRVEASLDGLYGTHADATAKDTLTCNWPGEASVSAYADCWNQPRITIRSDDGGTVIYEFTATSEDNEQVVEVSGTVEVEPGKQTIQLNWAEALDRFGEYSFSYSVDFTGNYGSSAHDEGSLSQVCNTPGGATISAYADCFNNPSITVSSEDGGTVTYQFVATSEDGEQTVEVSGTAEVETGTQTINLAWNQELNRLGTYTFTKDVSFVGRHGSSAEDHAELNQVCNEPPPPENPWIDGKQRFEPDKVDIDPTLIGMACVTSWNLGINDGQLNIPVLPWMTDIREVQITRVWDGSEVPWSIQSHPEWGESWQKVIVANAGKLSAHKIWKNCVSYQLRFDITPNTTPGTYGHVSSMTWTHDGKPWGNCWGAEIEIIRGGGPIRVRNPDGTYTVQAGDSLYWIARSFGATVAAIAEANGITNPDMIFVGQKLIIP